MIQTFSHPPTDFRCTFEGAGCFIALEGGELLYLKRAPSRPAPNTWCIPGGKIEEGETPRSAVIREIGEEVGLAIDTPHLISLGPLYLRRPDYDYVFHIFHHFFLKKPTLQLDTFEHTEFRWVFPDQILSLPLIPGGPEALHYYAQSIEGMVQRRGSAP